MAALKFFKPGTGRFLAAKLIADTAILGPLYVVSGDAANGCIHLRWRNSGCQEQGAARSMAAGHDLHALLRKDPVRGATTGPAEVSVAAPWHMLVDQKPSFIVETFISQHPWA